MAAAVVVVVALSAWVPIVHRTFPSLTSNVSRLKYLSVISYKNTTFYKKTF